MPLFLPWRLLGLWAVRADFRIEGVWGAAFDPIVRFVLTDREIPQPEYRVSAVAHLVAAPLLLVVSLALAWVGVRCRRVRR